MGLKRFCAIFLMLIMTITMTPLAYAATDEKAGDTIGTIDQLKTECEQAEKDGTVTVAERTEILKEVTPAVYQEFRREIFQEAAEASENIELSTQLDYDEQTDTFTTEKTIDLESGGVLTVKISDEPDATPSSVETTFNLLSWLIEPAYATNKAYGDRKFTATHNVYHFLYPDTKLVLATGYSIGDYGLKTRYTNGVGTYGIGVVAVDHETWVEDPVATGVGADINGRGYYELHFGPLPAVGLTAFTAEYGIRSTIKLNYLNKANKYADVTESFKASLIGVRPL